MKRLEGLHVLIGGMEKSRICELALTAEAEGVAVLQLREKERPTREVLEITDSLRAILKKTTFIINDRADIALAVGADGVHLGQSDLPIEDARALLGEKAIIGISTGSVEEAIVAETAGANYIGFGHMFATRSKVKENQPRTPEELEAVITAVSIPVIAIGGITHQNLSSILIPGLGGVAVIGAISESADPRTTIRQFVNSLKKHHVAIA
jgi:thiamine-phosphate diphosphorylase